MPKQRELTALKKHNNRLELPTVTPPGLYVNTGYMNSTKRTFSHCVNTWLYILSKVRPQMFEDVPLVEHLYPVFYTHAKWSYHREFGSVVVSLVC